MRSHRCFIFDGRHLAVVALALALAVPAVARAGSIGAINMGPQFELPNWNPGVRGGIPDTGDTTKWPVWTGAGTPLPSGASVAQMQSAVSAAAAAPLAPGQQGWVIQLPAGTSNWGDNQRLSLKSNIVLRGQGRSTRIRGRGNDNCPSGQAGNTTRGGMPYGCGHIITKGTVGPDVAVRNTSMPRGHKDFQVSNGDLSSLGVSVGNWVHLYNLDKADGSASCFGYELPKANNTPREVFAMIGKITNMLANTPSSGTTTVRIDTGLSMDWTPGVPCGTRIQRFDAIENVGIENLAVSANLPVRHNATDELISMNGVVNWWIKDSLIEDGAAKNIDIRYSAFGSIVGNEIGRTLCADATTYGDATYWILSGNQPAANNCSNYSIHVDYSAGDLLIANNVFRNSNTDIRYYLGNWRVVFAHNYQREFMAMADGQADGMKIHGFWSHGLLFEGNDYESNGFQSDLFWGPNGQSVLYRNRLRDTRGKTGGFFVRDIGPVGYSAQPDLITVGNIAWAYFKNQFCDYENKDNCYGLDQESDAFGRGGHYYAYNVARDPRVEPSGKTSPGWGFVIEDRPTTVCPGGCPGSTNIERVNKGDASWSNVQVPGSLFAADRQDWERMTGADWCDESCNFDDPHQGLGAFGDDFGAPLCTIPAERRFKGQSCTRTGSGANGGGGTGGGGGGGGGGGQLPPPPVPPVQL